MRNIQKLVNESPVKLIRSDSANKEKILQKPIKMIQSNKIFKKKTHHIDLVSIRENLKLTDSDNVIQNFSQLVKQIIATSNKNILNGDVNLIEYVISKYTDTPVSEICNFESISLKIAYENGLLNQFGFYLPKLKVLKLNYSCITTFSDVGSSFGGLKQLSITNTGLKDLNGNINLNLLIYILLIYFIYNYRYNMSAKFRSFRCFR